MATPVEITTPGFRVEPCIRCAWPEGSGWTTPLAASEREAERAEERHEHYCLRGARPRRASTPQSSATASDWGT